jgi:hypothetical protein
MDIVTLPHRNQTHSWAAGSGYRGKIEETYIKKLKSVKYTKKSRRRKAQSRKFVIHVKE